MLQVAVLHYLKLGEILLALPALPVILLRYPGGCTLTTRISIVIWATTDVAQIIGSTSLLLFVRQPLVLVPGSSRVASPRPRRFSTSPRGGPELALPRHLLHLVAAWLLLPFQPGLDSGPLECAVGDQRGQRRPASAIG